jgi:hypothetical protein
VIAAARKGQCWYRPVNHRRVHTQIAAQRWIAELAETGRVTRGQKYLLEELAKHVDAKGTTQKSIAFLARRCRVAERTLQIWLRGLCPSKAADPKAWSERILTRRFIHAVPEPGKQADNVPSWFTLEIPERFFAPKVKPPRRPPSAPPAPPRAPRPRSPGGVEKITQAVILGSDPVKISESLHPCSNLGRPGPRSPAPRPPPEIPVKAAPTPRPPPAEGAPLELAPTPTPAPPSVLAVALCAQLFPSHAPVAHKAVARLTALGWTDDQIARYLRKASKDPSLGATSTRHPLLAAVWLAERQFRDAPKLERPPDRLESPPPSAETPRPGAKTPPPLRSAIETARATLEAAERKTGVKRRITSKDPPRDPGGGDGSGGAQ